MIYVPVNFSHYNHSFTRYGHLQAVRSQLQLLIGTSLCQPYANFPSGLGKHSLHEHLLLFLFFMIFLFYYSSLGIDFYFLIIAWDRRPLRLHLMGPFVEEHGGWLQEIIFTVFESHISRKLFCINNLQTKERDYKQKLILVIISLYVKSPLFSMR